MVLIALFIFGLIFGSFVNALVWRVHTKKDLLKARSQCVHCGHELAAKDLVPVLSWLFLWGRCRYCRKPISAQYPVVEALMGIVFAASYHYWPGGVFGYGEAILFVTWLAVSVGLMALLLYDLKWMLLPNKILYPTFFIAATGRLLYIIVFDSKPWQSLLMWLLAIAVSSGLFYLIFYLSKEKWIGFGDVRLGLITGTILAKPSLAGLMIFAASLLGLIQTLPMLLSGQKKLSAKVPFGPFLITATWLVLLFGERFLNWYQNLLQ